MEFSIQRFSSRNIDVKCIYIYIFAMDFYYMYIPLGIVKTTNF